MWASWLAGLLQPRDKMLQLKKEYSEMDRQLAERDLRAKRRQQRKDGRRETRFKRRMEGLQAEITQVALLIIDDISLVADTSVDITCINVLKNSKILVLKKTLVCAEYSTSGDGVWAVSHFRPAGPLHRRSLLLRHQRPAAHLHLQAGPALPQGDGLLQTGGNDGKTCCSNLILIFLSFIF